MWPHLKRMSTRSKSREIEPLGEIKSDREEHDNLQSKRINSLTINLREMTFVDQNQNLIPAGKNRPPKVSKGKQNFQNLSHRFSHFDQLNHENIKLKAKVDELQRKVDEQNNYINKLQNYVQNGSETKQAYVNISEEGGQTLKLLVNKFRENLDKINKSTQPLKLKEQIQNYKHLIDILDNLSKNVPRGDLTTRSTVVQSNATEEDQILTSRMQDKIDFENIPIEKLKLLGSLGIGGSSSVHKALYEGEEVAVKKIFRGGERAKELEKTFWQEVNIIKKIRHPKIILFMGTAKTADHYYIVTEYMSRRSLDLVLKDKDIVLDLNIKLNMTIDIVKGLCFLHSLDPPILHRDLKTANCLCNDHFEIKLADFGLAKMKDQNFNTNSIATVKYMAPEFITKQLFTPKSDIFSFGMILWEIFSRKEPFEQLNPTQALYAIAVNKRPEIPADTPDVIKTIICECWHQDPQQRPEFPDILNRLKEFKNILG